MNNKYKAIQQKYKETSVTSASREKILLMLYEGAIRFLKKAIVAAETKNISDRGLYIGKVYDIVMELSNTLNFEVGGQTAVNLEQLYMFIMSELTKANVSGNIEHLHVVMKLLTTLNEGWVKAVESLKNKSNDIPTDKGGKK